MCLLELSTSFLLLLLIKCIWRELWGHEQDRIFGKIENVTGDGYTLFGRSPTNPFSKFKRVETVRTQKT
jgi:hypothetical protein